MPDLKTSISLSETEFKKGTYLPGLTSKYTQDERVKPRDLMVFSGQDPWHLLSDRPSYANHLDLNLKQPMYVFYYRGYSLAIGTVCSSNEWYLADYGNL